MKRLVIFLLKHTVLIVVLLFILVGILYREVIFGVTGDALDSTPAEELSSPPHGGIEQPAVENRSAEKEDVAPVPAPPSSTQPGPLPETVPPPVPVPTEQPAETETGHGDEASSAGLADGGSNSVDTITEPLPEMAPPETVGSALGEAPASPGEVTGEARMQMLEQARKAYWEGDLPAAENYYKSLIARFPNDADAHGELGDLYFTQEKLALAAVKYEDAARLLFTAGNRQGARDLIGVLGRFSPQLAEALDKELFGQ